jgi:hypothetical protein
MSTEVGSIAINKMLLVKNEGFARLKIQDLKGCKTMRNKNGMITGLLTGLLVWMACTKATAAQPANIQIENQDMRVVFNPGTSIVAGYSKHREIDFIRKIQFTDAPVSGRMEAVNDSVWGAGQTMVLIAKNNTVHAITLYQNLPFIFLQTTLKNADREPLEIPRYTPFEMLLNIGKKPEQLKAHGTGGLTHVDGKSNSGSYAFLSIVDPNTRSGVVSAWLTNEKGSGVVFSDIKNGDVLITPRIDYGALQIKGGQTETLEIFIIGWFDDARLGLEAYADTIAKKYAIHLPPQPTVYCTWYHAKASNEQNLIKNAEFAEKNLRPFGFSVIQIDDGWQEGVKQNGPKKDFSAYKKDGPYPSGMKATADAIKEMGLVPGIWFMPFAGTFDDPYFADKQYLFATKDGKPFDTKWGGTCLDMTNPKTQKYVYDIAYRIAHDWGYQYFKMDGLYTGTATRLTYVNDKYKDDNIGESKLYDPFMTHIQAYRTGLQIVRKAAGDKVFFLGCCIPQNMRSFAPAMGLVDAMRIGPDNSRKWSAMCWGPNYGSRVYFLNGRVWYNDPDPIYVRDDVPLAHAQTLASWVTISGQLSASSEDYLKLSLPRVDMLRRTMPSHGLKPRPVDIFEQDVPRIWLLTDESTGVRRDIIALYNWDDKNAAQINCSLEKIGLDADRKYVGFDFWANTFVDPFRDNIKVSLPMAGCKIFSVRPVSNTPQLISTSRHITQGIIDVKDEKWDNSSKSLLGISEVVGADPYELRIVAAKESGSWEYQSARVSNEDKQAGVTIKQVNQEAAYLRVLIESKENRRVKWQVSFK